MTQELTDSVSYVEQRDRAFWIAGARVSLDSVVYAYWSGQTAESITQSFPTLTLEQVYGGITFYLAHRDEIDCYLSQRRTDYQAARDKSRAENPALYAQLAAAKRDTRQQ